MAKVTDLYAILRAYSHKLGSPYIDIGVFITFLSKYIHHLAVEQPEWADWIPEISLRFWNTLGGYTENGRCVLLTDTPDGRIYLPYYMVDKLKEAYQNLDASADVPFPNEEAFKLSLPPDQVQVLNVETDLDPYFDKSAASFLPVIKLTFPDNKDALILAPMIPQVLLEASIFKVRYYFDQHNNKEYITHKLMPMFQGKEGILRENIEMVVSRPQDCLGSIEGGRNASYLFWASLCSLVKEDIRKKVDKFSSDIAVMEAVYTIEICLNHYKSQVQKERVKEIALRSLDQNMDKVPYYFTQDQIIKFTDSKGAPLLTQYTEADLNKYIKKKTSEGQDGLIPEWLVISMKSGEQYYLKKDKYLPLVSRFIIDAQGVMKQTILSRWTAMLNNFKSEPAMENDAEFERLLAGLNASMNPLLNDFLNDKKLFWVYDETERTQKVIPIASRVFERGKLIPYSLLFLLKRKELFFDAKMSLPFWYSIPIIRSIVAFFSRMGKKKKQNRRMSKKAEALDFDEAESSGESAKDHAGEFINSIRDMETELIPGNRDINSYLKELQNHWGQLVDPKAQQDLVDDVNSLIRDNLRRSLRLWGRRRVSLIDLRDLAQGIIYGNVNLRGMANQDSLLLYMQVYIVKLLKTVKA
jgi:hypothetical protein